MKGIVAPIAMLVVLAIAIAVLSPQQQVQSVKSAESYVQLARADAMAAGIDPDIFERQINQESGFQPHVISHAGAIGIAQFMPETAKGLGVNPYDPVQSLQGAAQMMGRYVRGYGSEALALAAYNAGSGTVSRCLHTRNWYTCLPGETQRYIAIILQW